MVVYDRLVSDDIMNLVRRDADRVFVGKRADDTTAYPVKRLTRILLREAQKANAGAAEGGDPFIFGRGGEDGNTVQRGYSVLGGSGITAASGCSAYSGIPLTHRDYARACA